MLTTPEVIPVTRPEALTVAMATLPLVQLPPGSVLLRAVVPPIQAVCDPVIPAGAGLTVIVVVAVHPEVSVNVIVAVPAEMPVTRPEAEPIVATDGLLLVHDKPPEVGSVRTVVNPVQIAVLPEIAAGRAFVVTDFET